MKMKEFRELTKDLSDDTEILLYNEVDDDDEDAVVLNHLKINHVLKAYANKFEVDHINFDITVFVNDGIGTIPVLVVSEVEIPRMIRTQIQGVADSSYTVCRPEHLVNKEE